MSIQNDLFPPQLTPPNDIDLEEGRIQTKEGLDLFWRCWTSKIIAPTHGVILIQHGYSEHGGRYHHLASFFTRKGFRVFAFDARGHGKSSGTPGYIAQYSDYIEDFYSAVKFIKNRTSAPIFVFAHSNGGLIALSFELYHPGQIEAYAFSSPFLGVRFPVPSILKWSSKLLSKVAPKLRLSSKILPPHPVSHIEDVNKHYFNDPLSYQFTTPHWALESAKAQKYLMDNADQFHAPALFLVSADDNIVDPQETQKLFFHLGSSERRFYSLPGLYHENMNENGWQERAEMVTEWFNQF